MAAVKVVRPPLCGDAAKNVPREQWPILLEERRNFCRGVLPHDCRLLLFFVDDAQQSQWLGFATRENYLRDGLGLDPEQVAWAIEGLQRLKPDEPIKYDWAIELGKHGGKRTKGQKQGDNVTLKERGNSRAYILARLDRDRPELAAQVRAGTLSANAAATKAGFRKNLSCTERAQKLVLAMTKIEFQNFKTWINNRSC